MTAYLNGVEAVPSNQIDRVTSLLIKHHSQLYADVWCIGINMSLRISDLLSVKYADIKHTHRGSVVTVKEKKTGKKITVTINEKALGVIKRRKKENPKHKFIFESTHHHSIGRPVSRNIIARKFKDVGEILGIRIATHSMRKTRGMIMHEAGVPIEHIAAMLNHTNTSTTMHYIGLTHQKIQDNFLEFQL